MKTKWPSLTKRVTIPELQVCAIRPVARAFEDYFIWMFIKKYMPEDGSWCKSQNTIQYNTTEHLYRALTKTSLARERIC